MKFAVNTHVSQKPGLLSTKERIDELEKEAALSDQLGFDFFFSQEHHFSQAFTLATNPTAIHTIIARCTEKIRLGPMTYVVPISQPLRVAEDICFLDQISNGRLDVGFSKGVVWHEHGAFGVRESEAGERLKEGMDFILKAISAEGVFSFNGKYYQGHEIEMAVHPFDNGPRIWIPTATPNNAYSWGKRGFGVMGFSWLGLDLHVEVFKKFREGLAASESLNKNVDSAYLSSYIVAETESEARHLAEVHFREQVALFEYEEGRSFKMADSFEVKHIYRGILGLFDRIKNDFDGFSIPQKIIIYGTPERVAEQILELEDLFGISTVLSEFNLGMMKWKDVEKSMTLFAKEVMPRVNKNK